MTAPPLSLYRAAVDAVHQDVRDALANWGIVRAAAREARLRDRIFGTLHSGYAAETILNSCTTMALLAAARLWDEAAKPHLCRTIATPMGAPDVEANMVASLCGAGIPEPEAQRRIRAFGKCASQQLRRARRAHEGLQPIRDRWIAHRQVSAPSGGGTHFHQEGGALFPTIHFLVLVYRAHLLASGAEQMLNPRFAPEAFRNLCKEFVENGSAFWLTYVSAPLAVDDLDRPR